MGFFYTLNTHKPNKTENKLKKTYIIVCINKLFTTLVIEINEKLKIMTLENLTTQQCVIIIVSLNSKRAEYIKYVEANIEAEQWSNKISEIDELLTKLNK